MHSTFSFFGTRVLDLLIRPKPGRRAFTGLLVGTGLLCLLGCSDDPSPRLSPLKPLDVVLAFGDSLTHGTGASIEASYPAVLSKLIGFEVLRQGVPGELSGQGLERLPALLDRYRPALLILCHGGNDILQRHDAASTAANLAAMIRTAQSRGVEVLLVAVPEFGLTGLSAAEVYSEVAEETRVPLESDALTDILAKQSLRSDLVHPNAKGYKQLAQRIAAALKDFGALP